MQFPVNFFFSLAVLALVGFHEHLLSCLALQEKWSVAPNYALLYSFSTSHVYMSHHPHTCLRSIWQLNEYIDIRNALIKKNQFLLVWNLLCLHERMLGTHSLFNKCLWNWLINKQVNKLQMHQEFPHVCNFKMWAWNENCTGSYV